MHPYLLGYQQQYPKHYGGTNYWFSCSINRSKISVISTRTGYECHHPKGISQSYQRSEIDDHRPKQQQYRWQQWNAKEQSTTIQFVISDLDFSVYKKDAFGKQWSIFQLEWNEDLFNATYRPKFSRTEFLTIFTRDLYNKLQLQAIAVGLDIFNDEMIDNSVQYWVINKTIKSFSIYYYYLVFLIYYKVINNTTDNNSLPKLICQGNDCHLNYHHLHLLSIYLRYSLSK